MPKINSKIPAIAGLGLLLIAIFIGVVFRLQQKLTIYDPQSYGPYGFRALALLMEQSSFTLKVIPEFNGRIGGSLLITTSGPIDPPLRQQLLKWVNQGGTLIELAQAEPGILPEQAETAPIPRGRGTIARSKIAWLKGLEYQIKNESIYGSLQPGAGYYYLNEFAVIFLQQIGQGQVIIWTDPDGLTNRHLKSYPDNAVIFMSVLKQTGSPHPISMLDLRYRTVPLAKPKDLFQKHIAFFLLLIAGLTLTIWKLATRFGRPRPLVLAKGRSADEFLTSIANLFQQADAQSVVLKNIWQELLITGSEITVSPPSLSPAAVLLRLTELTGKDTDWLIQLYRKTNGFEIKLPQRQFLLIAAKLDSFRRELATWKK